MTNAKPPTPESLHAQIARLEQQLEMLLSEAPIMDDEVNAIERDLRALRQTLSVAQ
jgi:HAMP domain-containing protein